MVFAFALRVKASFTWATDQLGFDSRSKAAAPETCGHAIEVPLIVAESESCLWPADKMSLPGA